jgi:hypothetical protein
MKLFHSVSLLVLLVSTALTVACLPQAEASVTVLQRTVAPRRLSSLASSQAQLIERSRPSPLEGRSLPLPAESVIFSRNNRFLEGLKSKLKECVRCVSSSRLGGRRGGAGGGGGGERHARGAVHPVFSPVRVQGQAGGQGPVQPLVAAPLHRQDAQDMDAFLNALEHIN